MGLDHSKAFVRVSFDGLIGFCFCRRDDFRCEMGMLQAEDHEPLISITRIHQNGTRTTFREPRRLSRTDHVRIETIRPEEAGALTFPPSLTESSFDRLSDDNDPEDFRWVMDLQGPDFHGQELKLRRGPDNILLPRITIPHGIFYTRDKTQFVFRRTRNPEDRGRPIGKIADRMGADILCKPDPHDKDGQKLVTVNIGDEEIKLFRNTEDGEVGLRYSIKITNLCRRPGTGGATCRPDESDFPQYYKVAEDTDGIEFDVRTMHEPDDNLGKKRIEGFSEGNEPFPQFEGFKSDGAPQVCAMVFFGLANSLPKK